MSDEPRFADDYEPRQVTAARRVIVDVMQVLASFEDCLVLVGGWVPDLVIADTDEPHIGSIDVDLALDAGKLDEGRYAEMLKLLLGTKRYWQGEKEFQFVTEVDLGDGEKPVVVEVEFLAPKEVKTRKNKPKLLEGFRVLKADGCAAAFHSPLSQKLKGEMVSGATNTVSLQVASVPDFLVMKAFALIGRDKPKDAYDICYCLDHYAGGISELAEAWRSRKDDADVSKAIEYLGVKFESVESYGPMQVVEFHNETDPETRQEQARRAYELVRQFLAAIEEKP
ncbi:protocatechuate3,4-dioxygenase [Haloferula helveola]|uniref:Protocatechuate3,4-dioxygenase n=1 Tax=Haloferula helveola TaxID=490095 RepID=A0ABM7RDM9_9BACT|nr:protocatechuate3,4-dioxygenase [Haloferula helveola]